MAADNPLRILIMAGGTGGHVIPALSVAEYLRSLDVQLAWLGTRAGIEADLVPANDIQIHFLDIEGLRGRGLRVALKAPLLLWRSIRQALSVLAEFQPQVILGMGGFASGPGAVAAWLKRIPIVIHEQNSIAGTTNRITALFARRVLQGFPDTLARGEWLGNPVRPNISQLPHPEQRLSHRSGKLRLLILGGSRGALAINQLLPRALAKLDLAPMPEVWHQTGKTHLQTTRDAYHQQGIEVDDVSIRVVPFIDSMAEAYHWCDFVICRAGALTVAELTSAGIGALLIPFPFAIDDHQTINGRLLVDHDAALMIAQTDITEESLSEVITDVSRDPDKRLSMAINARKLAKNDAAEKVAGVCMEVAND